MACKVGIIGAGASGLMAAIFAANAGADVCVFESNTSAGRKLLQTGGGRCNLTSFAQPKDLLNACRPFDKFLSYSIYEFPPKDVIGFFNCRHVATYVEADGSVFPSSNRAGDILNVLIKECQKLNIRFLYGKKVSDVDKIGSGFKIKADNNVMNFHSVVIATGGASWPGTGSTGDGYKMADKFGHKVFRPKACLVPLVTSQKWVANIAGVSLEKVKISVVVGNKKAAVAGPLVFTSTGIGGPAVLNFSRIIVSLLAKKALPISIDLLPEYSFDQLSEKIKTSCEQNAKKEIETVLSFFLPKSLAAEIYKITGADKNLKAAQLSRKFCHSICTLIKALPVTVESTRTLKEATITRGGICLSEINNKTMESKLVKGLFFAGELINVDGPCGGYNLQIAWSTGALAGKSAASVF